MVNILSWCLNLKLFHTTLKELYRYEIFCSSNNKKKKVITSDLSLMRKKEDAIA